MKSNEKKNKSIKSERKRAKTIILLEKKRQKIKIKSNENGSQVNHAQMSKVSNRYLVPLCGCYVVDIVHLGKLPTPKLDIDWKLLTAVKQENITYTHRILQLILQKKRERKRNTKTEKKIEHSRQNFQKLLNNLKF